jgi:hypothetical protein
MAINQLSTANTFQEWLSTTSTLVALANNLTDGVNGSPFIMNTAIIIGGANSSLNVYNHTNVNTLRANSSNIANVSFSSGNIAGNGTLTISNITVNSNIAAVNTTGNLAVGGDAFIYGNLTISGNVTLDSIGFDDLNVAGSIAVADTLNVTGCTYLTNIELSGNVISSLNVTSNLVVANQTILYNRITAPNANIAWENAGGYANIANINFASGNITANGLLTTRSINVWSNVTSINTTGNLWVGGDTFIYGNLTISGNVTLDTIGFDDLSVAGSVNSSNLNTSTGNITLLVGDANTAIYSNITSAIDSAIAFAIALG